LDLSVRIVSKDESSTVEKSYPLDFFARACSFGWGLDCSFHWCADCTVVMVILRRRTERQEKCDINGDRAAEGKQSVSSIEKNACGAARSTQVEADECFPPFWLANSAH